MTQPRGKSRRAFVRSAGASLLSLAHRARAGTELTLASAGRSSYSIYLSPSASPSERWAADELRRYLREMSGADLPIASAGQPPESADVIAIGQSALTQAAKIEPPTGESFLLRTVGRNVFVAGGPGRGAMYGVYTLLDKLGCRWFTADVARVPRLAALRLPVLDERHSPAFEYREVFFTEALGKEWSARNRLNGHFHQLDASVGGKFSFQPFAHSFYDLVPPSEFFAEHPEYFALVAGRRRAAAAQLCLTNPEVLRISLERVIEWIADFPDISIFSVSPNDGGGWCECDPCRRVIEEEGGAASGLLLRFVNEVAGRISASHPGKTIDTLAYLDTFDPPAKTRPRSNVSVRLCPIDACQSHSYFTCPYNRRVAQTITNWSRISPKLYLWQYGVNFSHYLFPFPNYDELAADIPRFRRLGVSGIFLEGAGSGGGRAEDAELRSYIAARLLWEPDAPVEPEIHAFLRAVYGPAAGAMWEYFALRHREVRRGRHLWIDQDDCEGYFPPQLAGRARALLLHARERAISPAAIRRIETCMLSIGYAAALGARRFTVRAGSYAPRNADEARRETRAVVSRAQELGLVQFREGYPLSREASDYEELLRTYPAVSISDGALEATVVPDLEARIVRLSLHRGPNLLRVAVPGEWAYPRAGGLCVRLHTDRLSAPRPVEWRIRGVERDRVNLTGITDSGLACELVVQVRARTLACVVTVRNPTSDRKQVHLRWRAGLPLHPAPAADRRVVLEGVQLLSGEGSTLRPGFPAIRNRFRPEQAALWMMTESHRGEAQADLSLWSPEVSLDPEGSLSLASEYELF
jgi:hypothetical protein